MLLRCFVCCSVLVWLAFRCSACACFSLCARVVLFVAVAIWCNRATMRCNRFSASGGVVLPCACSCDFGAFYKRLLLYWLMACGRAVPRRVAVAVAVAVGWRVPLSADGVRMARIGFMYVDIYLYAVAVGVACGASSCSCGSVVWLINICKVCLCGLWWWCGVAVSCLYMYLWIYCACGGGVLLVVVCLCRAWIYLYRDGLRSCSCIHLPAIVLYPKFK